MEGDTRNKTGHKSMAIKIEWCDIRIYYSNNSLWYVHYKMYIFIFHIKIEKYKIGNKLEKVNIQFWI